MWHFYSHLITPNIFQGSNEEKVFLFPLCGKSIDVAWVYRQGHKVIGIEVVVEAVSQLFSEASIPYKVQPMDACKGWKYCVRFKRDTDPPM